MEALSIANDLSARMSGLTKEEYVDFHETAIDKFDKLLEMVGKVNIKSIEDYQEAMRLKGVLASLFCYTFNNDKKDDFERASNLENELGNKIAKYARNFARVRGEKASLVRYLCHQAGWKYRNDDTTEIIKILIAENCLFKDDEGRFWVTGLHLAVGDNVFGFNKYTGREHRLYVKTCVIQAFYCNNHWQRILKKYDESGAFPRIQTLPDYYHKTYVGNYKHHARVYLTRKDKNYIQDNFVNDRW